VGVRELFFGIALHSFKDVDFGRATPLVRLQSEVVHPVAGIYLLTLPRAVGALIVAPRPNEVRRTYVRCPRQITEHPH